VTGRRLRPERSSSCPAPGHGDEVRLELPRSRSPRGGPRREAAGQQNRVPDENQHLKELARRTSATPRHGLRNSGRRHEIRRILSVM